MLQASLKAKGDESDSKDVQNKIKRMIETNPTLSELELKFIITKAKERNGWEITDGYISQAVSNRHSSEFFTYDNGTSNRFGDLPGNGNSGSDASSSESVYGKQSDDPYDNIFAQKAGDAWDKQQSEPKTPIEEARAFLLTNKDEKNAELLIRTESEKRGWDLNDSDIKIVQESMVDEPSIARTINRWVDTIKEIQNEHDQYEKEEADVEKMKDILTEQLIGEKEIATDGSLQDLGWRNKRILNEALKAIYKGNEDYIN